MRTVVLYSRPGCHLCDELEEDLDQQFGTVLMLERRCVDDQPQWRERFGLQVPVLTTPDGEVLCRVVLDSEAVESYLART